MEHFAIEAAKNKLAYEIVNSTSILPITDNIQHYRVIMPDQPSSPTSTPIVIDENDEPVEESVIASSSSRKKRKRTKSERSSKKRKSDLVSPRSDTGHEALDNCTSQLASFQQLIGTMMGDHVVNYKLVHQQMVGLIAENKELTGKIATLSDQSESLEESKKMLKLEQDVRKTHQAMYDKSVEKVLGLEEQLHGEEARRIQVEKEFLLFKSGAREMSAKLEDVGQESVYLLSKMKRDLEQARLALAEKEDYIKVLLNENDFLKRTKK